MPLVYENVIGPQVALAVETVSKAGLPPTVKNIHTQFCKDIGGEDTPADIPESAFREWFKKLGYSVERTPTIVAPKD